VSGGLRGVTSVLGAPRRLVDPRLRTPSWAYKNQEMRRVGRLGRGLGAVHPVWSVNDKDAAHAWAQRLGVATARLVARHDDADDVCWAALPDAVVVKPVHGSGSVGVHLLLREGRAWRELRRDEVVTGAQVTERLRERARVGRISSAVVVEEMVQDPRCPGRPPVDWKLHTFFGRIGLVVAKSHRLSRGRPSPRWRIFDEHWADLGAAVSHHRLDRRITPPVHAEQLLEVARLVSSAVPRPFLRVDLYDGADGVVLGEITPEPGYDHRFRRDVDRRLGELWEDAEARLLLRLVPTGALDPADRALPESALGLAARTGSARDPQVMPVPGG
jgi:hypothetical protein